MSRYILGDCVQVMSRFPARAVDFILTDPRIWLALRTVPAALWPGTILSEWLQPACHEMYRVLKTTV
jgi:site-specific DNA-methyltransferase (adenine-specific)